MIAFALVHPGWFAIAAIAVECAIIFGLMIALPRLAMIEPPEWMDLPSSLPGDEPGSPASSPLVNAGEPTISASVRA